MAVTTIDESALSQPVLELLAEVRSLGPAPVFLYLGSVDDLYGTAGGKHEWENRSGPSSITVVDPENDCLLAHELLHVAFLRRGFPMLELRPDGVPQGVGELANLIEDASIHPVLWHELRSRGFDDSAYWSVQRENLDTAAEPEWPLRNYTGALCDAIVLADMLASAPSVLEGALERVKSHSPLTSEIAGKLYPLIGRSSGEAATDRAAVMDRVIGVADDVLAEHGFPYFRLRTWLRIDF